jgi:uncharacterized protein
MLETLIEPGAIPRCSLPGASAVGLACSARWRSIRASACARRRSSSPGGLGPKLAVWLLTFASAVIVCQWAILTGSPRPVSGCPADRIGGQHLGRADRRAHVRNGHDPGAGLRQPASCPVGHRQPARPRHGLILTIVAQASLRGGLSPARETLAGLWTVGAAHRAIFSAVGNRARFWAVSLPGRACLRRGSSPGPCAASG